MVDVEDLPVPPCVPDSRHQPHTPCPRWDQRASRHNAGHRTVHDRGALSTGRPVDLLVTDASPSCAPCQTSGTIDRSDVAPPGSHDPHRVRDMAVRRVVEERMPSRPARGHLWRAPRVFGPLATRHNGGEAGGKTGAGTQDRCVAGLGTGDLVGGRRCRCTL